MERMLKLSSIGIVIVLLLAMSVFAQYPEREDVIWARSVDGAAITMDGMMNEAVWAQAESLHVVYGVDGPLPTSAWRPEYQPDQITDPTNATVKFLSDGSFLYVGFFIPDSSVGGTQDWARWDGILMSIKDHRVATRPTPPMEFFYTWWYADVDSLIAPGTPPMFRGTFENTQDTARTAEQKAVWDGKTFVQGISNDDSQPDQYWSVELRFNLDSLGYDVTKPEGEIFEFNFSIWDEDWIWSGDPFIVSATRAWWQSPWNGNADNVGRVHIRSDVTVNSGPVPDVDPDMVLRNGSTLPSPLIDGMLTDDAWMYADSFDIRWNDTALRNSYPGVGKWRSGQFQPDVDTIAGLAPVLDSASAQIKMFFRDDYLYLSADVNDKLVQSTTTFDRMDGVRFIVGDRVAVDGDNRMLFRQLRGNFDTTGTGVPMEFMVTLVDSTNSEFAMIPKPNTTVDDNSDVDEGYTIEMKVDLTYLGYPPGLGDHLLFMGVMLADGDSFLNPENDYGTRTWWFREHNNGPAAAWMYMDASSYLSIGSGEPLNVAQTLQLHGNYPNPFNPATTISYTVPFTAEVVLQVYDVLGQKVTEIAAGKKIAGSHEMTFNGSRLGSGIYFYKLQAKNEAGNKTLNSRVSKMILIK